MSNTKCIVQDDVIQMSFDPEKRTLEFKRNYITISKIHKLYFEDTDIMNMVISLRGCDSLTNTLVTLSNFEIFK